MDLSINRLIQQLGLAAMQTRNLNLVHRWLPRGTPHGY